MTGFLGDIIRQHKIDFHVYADDIQLYVPFNPKDPSAMNTALHKLERCIDELQTWMCKNKLKLNNNKTEFFIAGNKYWLSKLPQVTLKVGEAVIKPTPSVKNLGVVFDDNMSMTGQVSSIIKSTSFQLKNIHRIRRYLDRDMLHQVVRALVLSRIDYCNLLLNACSEKDLDRLQRLQNRAARLICSTSIREHITPVLRDLHWLKIRQRIKFKTALYVYKCINNHGPQYISEFLSPYHSHIDSQHSKRLRSTSDETKLFIPRAHSVLSRKSFSVFAPRLWNSISIHIRECTSISGFKKQLKTYLFSS